MSQEGLVFLGGRPEDLEIRPFTRDYQSEVRALILEGLAERWGTLDESLNRDLDDIATSYATGRVLLAIRRGQVVGTGIIVPVDPTTAEIVRMSVAPAARRDGVGRRIVDALLQVARSWSVQRVICETTSHWTSAVDFYSQCGFRVDHEEEGAFGRDTYFSYMLARSSSS
ncbi:MAG: GNAT family N-acetyltransferase [Actinomycetia bacterium]|nr:GNAT family N-acetyltransferase [Actinomycetes bacterium]